MLPARHPQAFSIQSEREKQTGSASLIYFLIRKRSSGGGVTLSRAQPALPLLTAQQRCLRTRIPTLSSLEAVKMYFLLCHFSFWQAGSQVGLENVKVGNKVVCHKKKEKRRERKKGKKKRKKPKWRSARACWEPPALGQEWGDSDVEHHESPGSALSLPCAQHWARRLCHRQRRPCTAAEVSVAFSSLEQAESTVQDKVTATQRMRVTRGPSISCLASSPGSCSFPARSVCASPPGSSRKAS